jgi:hypothetical protein
MKPALLLIIVAGVLLAANFAMAETIFGLTTDNRLFSFDSAAPNTVTQVNGFSPVNGLPPNEFLLAIDFRPVATNSPFAASNGVLYALGATHHLYTIDTSNGTATIVPAAPFTMTGNAFGADFNPAADLFRFVSDLNQNVRLNPNSGAVIANDTNLLYAPGDPNSGTDPNIVAAAYINNFGGAPQTTLYGIDSALDTLVRVGGINSIPSANAGQLFTIGGLGVDTTDEIGLDVSGQSGVAYASLTPTVGPLDTVSGFYQVNLATGAATFIGTIGHGGPGAFVTRDIAAPVGTPVPEPGTFGILVVGSAALLLARRSSWRR